MDKITVTKENIWDVVEHLRSLKFGVTIGTYGDSQYSVGLVYWPHKVSLKEQIADSPERAMQLALKFAQSYLELERLLESALDEPDQPA